MVLDDMPIFMNRAVAERGCSMTGGPTSLGITPIISDRRSWTCCLAVMASAPCLKIILTDERSVTDLERRMLRSGMPDIACSSGMVTSASTSVGASPRHGVWISTIGGANSGNTSTRMSRIWSAPMQISATASARTMNRYFRLQPTIRRNMVGDLLGRPLVAVLVLGAHQLRGPDGDDGGAGRRALGQDRPVAGDGLDHDPGPHVGERSRVRERPGLALGVVEDRAVGDDQVPALLEDLRGLDPDPVDRLFLEHHLHDAFRAALLEPRGMVDFGDVVRLASRQDQDGPDRREHCPTLDLHDATSSRRTWV